MKRAIAALALGGFATGAASGQIFFNETDWMNASGGNFVAPDYNNLAPISFPEGTTDFYGYFDVTSVGNGSATYNSARNFVFDFDALDTVTFTFDTPITSFAAIWSNTFVQDGFRVSTPFNDYDLNVLDPGLNAVFIGFVENTPFSTVTFTTSNPTMGDDFVFFNTFNFYEVPAPASAAILGMGGLVAARRRRV